MHSGAWDFTPESAEVTEKCRTPLANRSFSAVLGGELDTLGEPCCDGYFVFFGLALVGGGRGRPPAARESRSARSGAGT